MVALNENSPSLSNRLHSRKSYSAKEAWASGDSAMDDFLRTSIKPHEAVRGELLGTTLCHGLKSLVTWKKKDFDLAEQARNDFVRNEFSPEPGPLFHVLRANYHYARYFAHSLFN